jgi:hypothetical protein
MSERIRQQIAQRALEKQRIRVDKHCAAYIERD